MWDRADQGAREGAAGDAATFRPLASGFLDSSVRVPERPALVVDGRSVTYGELAERARSIAATLTASAPAEGPALTAVFAHRSATAYAGVLGALLACTGYVPLNRKFPPWSRKTRFA